MPDHDWFADPDWPRVVKEADWVPGLPPPIEALQLGFRPEEGWEITYGTHLDAGADGPRAIPIATANHPGHRSVTFFPSTASRASDHPGNRPAGGTRPHGASA